MTLHFHGYISNSKTFILNDIFVTLAVGAGDFPIEVAV